QALVEAVAGKQPEGRGEPLLAIKAFRLDALCGRPLEQGIFSWLADDLIHRFCPLVVGDARPLQPVDQPDEARLSRTRAADDAGDGPARDCKIDLMERPHARLVAIGWIGLGNGLEPDHGIRRDWLR